MVDLLVAIVSLFVLIELLTRWFIHRPIDAIRDTVRAVASGDLRTPGHPSCAGTRLAPSRRA